MSTLYKRATPSQARVLRIVEGAVKNTTDAHPNLKISPQHRRSIAKRAAGTLTAQWPDVLAARKARSESPDRTGFQPAPGQPAHPCKPSGRGGLRLAKASPLSRLQRELQSQIWHLERAGLFERVATFIYVLRIIARLVDDDININRRTQP